MNALVYDIEIVAAIPDKKSAPDPRLRYCEGWADHAGMGVSVIGVQDLETGRTRVFCADNLAGFAELVAERRLLVGFNNVRFDNQVLRAAGIDMPTDPTRYYDLLREMWVAAGLNPDSFGGAHGGFGLEATASVNLGVRKTGNGALAPVDWQFGRVGSVIDYCLEDVRLTTELFKLIVRNGQLVHPKNRDAKLSLPRPALVDGPEDGRDLVERIVGMCSSMMVHAAAADRMSMADHAEHDTAAAILNTIRKAGR